MNQWKMHHTVDAQIKKKQLIFFSNSKLIELRKYGLRQRHPVINITVITPFVSDPILYNFFLFNYDVFTVVII